MFTVKQLVNNETSIFEVDQIKIGKFGSDLYADGMKLHKDMQCDDASGEITMICVPVEDDCGMIAIHRGSGPSASPYAVASYDDHGDTIYQFIYPGDEIYVMNTHGSTVETVRQSH